MLLQMRTRLFREVACHAKLVSVMATRHRRHVHGSSSTNLRVLVDMDGVLCDFEQHFLDQFKATYPGKTPVPLDRRRCFYLSDDYEKIYEDEARVRKTFMFMTVHVMCLCVLCVCFTL